MITWKIRPKMDIITSFPLDPTVKILLGCTNETPLAIECVQSVTQIKTYMFIYVYIYVFTYIYLLIFTYR